VGLTKHHAHPEIVSWPALFRSIFAEVDWCGQYLMETVTSGRTGIPCSSNFYVAVVSSTWHCYNSSAVACVTIMCIYFREFVNFFRVHRLSVRRRRLYVRTSVLCCEFCQRLGYLRLSNSIH